MAIELGVPFVTNLRFNWYERIALFFGSLLGASFQFDASVEPFEGVSTKMTFTVELSTLGWQRRWILLSKGFISVWLKLYEDPVKPGLKVRILDN